MLIDLDNLLRKLFKKEVPTITSDDQVGFQPPDQDWRTVVTSHLGARNALNVYLMELRENRRLRSNESVQVVEDGSVQETFAPQRVDCHYLITAWSPAAVNPSLEPTADEHGLLYDVAAVLMNRASLVPREVYAPDPLPAGFPASIADEELPSTVLPIEGFPKYAEFWGTMGNIHPWKPAVYLVVTLPVALKKRTAGPLVTTRITEYRQSGLAETAEVWIQIGGTVLDASVNPPRPVPKAWVRLETTTNEPLRTTEANVLGRFTFESLRAGKYRLRASSPVLGEKSREVDVPSPTGEYDVRFP